MNIRGVTFQGFAKQRVNQADNRRIVLGIQQILRLGNFLGEAI